MVRFLLVCFMVVGMLVCAPTAEAQYGFVSNGAITHYDSSLWGEYDEITWDAEVTVPEWSDYSYEVVWWAKGRSNNVTVYSAPGWIINPGETKDSSAHVMTGFLSGLPHDESGYEVGINMHKWDWLFGRHTAISYSDSDLLSHP
jgi:hypothetical protein